MSSLPLTRHADLRAKQRGVTHATLEALIAYADVEAPVGSGCTAIRLSRGRLQDRELRSNLGPLADRLRSLSAIVANNSGDVVTVIRDHGRAAGRRYRRAY